MRRENSNKGENVLIPDATTMDFGGYALLNAKANQRWKFQGGIRADTRTLNTVPYSNVSKTIDKIAYYIFLTPTGGVIDGANAYRYD